MQSEYRGLQVEVNPLNNFEKIQMILKPIKTKRFSCHKKYKELLDEDFEKGSIDSTLLNWMIKPWVADYKEKLKRNVNSFIKEVMNEDHEWIKSRRLEYLKDKRKECREAVLPFIEGANVYKNTHDAYLGKVINEDLVFPVLKKVKKIDNEILAWTEPGYSGSKLTGDDIDRAREHDCCDFLEIKRKDFNRSWALCVFHEEKTPSLCIFKDSNHFKCFGCGEGGSVIDLVMKLYDKDFPSAVKFILKK